jgi:hypothetical protein
MRLLFASPGRTDAAVAHAKAISRTSVIPDGQKKGIILYHAGIWTSASGPDANHF